MAYEEEFRELQKQFYNLKKKYNICIASWCKTPAEKDAVRYRKHLDIVNKAVAKYHKLNPAPIRVCVECQKTLTKRRKYCSIICEKKYKKGLEQFMKDNAFEIEK